MNSEQLTLDIFGDLGRAVHGTVRLLVGRSRPPRVRNCAACDNDESCRQLADRWGPRAMACLRATRDENFRAKGAVPLRTCARCGTTHYTPWCTGCGYDARYSANTKQRGDHER